tara:strand:- start:15950 stop:16549 length:600 start_codon:yes stop_codon:yes gene_type:complete
LSKVSKKEELLQRAIALYKQDYKLVSISRELDVHTSTLRRWLRNAGYGAKKNPHGANPVTEEKKEDDPLQDALVEKLDEAVKEETQLEAHDARVAEDKDLLDVAQAQASPGEKYQSYVAATAVKLMRDSVKNLRGPRTIKELSELDQIIRRNLGLDNRGGSGKVQIDISILNNTKADKGKGAVDIDSKKVIDVEPLEDK